MNPLRTTFAWLSLAGSSILAQAPLPQAPLAADSVPPSVFAAPRRTAAELEQLLAPIALYPDALIALILPAATAPTDVVLAARHVRDNGGDPSQVEHRAWDESVKSLTHYPDLLRWMDENLQWTKQVGEAFAEQPAEVMQAIQRLRAQARVAGALVDTPQQQVVTDADVIRIVPMQSDAIYVPSYDPAVVFVREPLAWGRPSLSFGFGLPVGAWLAFDFDWRRHTIWVGDRHRRWTGQDWRRPLVPIPIASPTYAHRPDIRPWRPATPPPSRVRQPESFRASPALVQSTPVIAPGVNYAPTSPPARPTGNYQRTRRESPPGSVAVEARGAPGTLAPQLQMSPSPSTPAPTTVTAGQTPPPSTPPRNLPADRRSGEGPPTYTHQRHAGPSPSANAASTPSPAHPPAAAPFAYSRSAPPAPANSAPSAPPSRARPPSPPPPSTAPAQSPSSVATNSARPDAPPERPPGRRDPNVQER